MAELPPVTAALVDTSEERQQQQQQRSMAVVVGIHPPRTHHHHQTMMNRSNINNHNNNNSNSNNPKYRGGFSSSICFGLFQHHAHSHSDCCALACCGMFLEDRHRFLLTQQLPPPLWQRVLQYLVVPMVSLLLIWIIIVPPPITKNSSDEDKLQHANVALGRLILIVLVLVVLTWVFYCQAVSKRRQVRLMIQQKILQQQQQQDDNMVGISSANNNINGLDVNDLDASHPGCCCCGCYPVDRDNMAPHYSQEYDSPENDDNYYNNKPMPTLDLCYCLWKTLGNICCGWCCQCWCQCFGMCAIAQEDRELQLLLPPSSPAAATDYPPSSSSLLFQRDYITMQPYSDYYPKIQRVRQEHFYGIWEHAKALSQLSSHLLRWFFGILLLIIVSSLLPIQNWLKPLQLLVVFGTLGQALVLLFFVHWIFHRFDLSLDAVIKYFASGFLLCTGMAMIYELIVSLVFGLFLIVIKFIVMLIDAPGYAKQQQQQGNTDDATGTTPSSNNPWKEYTSTFDRNHLGLAIFGAFINAYLVAAAVEELTKYFSFWMVEHADFDYFHRPQQHQRGGGNEHGMMTFDASGRPVTVGGEGGGTTTTTTTYETIDMEGQQQQQEQLLQQQQEQRTTDTTAIIIAASAVPHHDYTLTTSPINGVGNNDHNDATSSLPLPAATTTRRTYQSIGAAITVAMVATAMGFACAENLLYVFAYTPPGFANEVSTLIARSIFPVHPLCAALQSIGVVHRDVVLPNGKNTFGLGRVLFPAWFLHGTFDFVLMTVAAYVTTKTPVSNDDATSGGSSGGSDDQANSNSSSNAEDDPAVVLASWISLGLSIGVVVLGFVYYQCAACRQRGQLRALDNQAMMATEAAAELSAAEATTSSHHHNGTLVALPEEQRASTSAPWLI